MKRNSIEVDALSLTRFRRKTLHNESEHVHSEKHAKTENVNATVQQAVADFRKHAFVVQNNVMSERDKRWNYNERVIFQRWLIIALQRMWSHDQDNRKKRDKKMQKKIIEKILQKIANIFTNQRNLIISFHKLSSEDIFLYSISSNACVNLKKTQE